MKKSEFKNIFEEQLKVFKEQLKTLQDEELKKAEELSKKSPPGKSREAEKMKAKLMAEGKDLEKGIKLGGKDPRSKDMLQGAWNNKPKENESKVKLPTPKENAERANSLADFTPKGNFDKSDLEKAGDPSKAPKPMPTSGINSLLAPEPVKAPKPTAPGGNTLGAIKVTPQAPKPATPGGKTLGTIRVAALSPNKQSAPSKPPPASTVKGAVPPSNVDTYLSSKINEMAAKDSKPAPTSSMDSFLAAKPGQGPSAKPGIFSKIGSFLKRKV